MAKKWANSEANGILKVCRSYLVQKEDMILFWHRQGYFRRWETGDILEGKMWTNTNGVVSLSKARRSRAWVHCTGRDCSFMVLGKRKAYGCSHC